MSEKMSEKIIKTLKVLNKDLFSEDLLNKDLFSEDLLIKNLLIIFRNLMEQRFVRKRVIFLV